MHSNLVFPLLITLAALCACGNPGAPLEQPGPAEEADEEGARLDYERDVQPVWDAHCTSCHGDNGTPQAGLTLRTGASFSALMETANNLCVNEDGSILELPLVAPGDPARSMLWIKLNTDLLVPTWPQCGREMPVVGTALGTTHPEVTETVRLWIMQGANGP